MQRLAQDCANHPIAFDKPCQDTGLPAPPHMLIQHLPLIFGGAWFHFQPHHTDICP